MKTRSPITTGTPPTDGSEVLAFGNLIYREDFCTAVEPFVEIIHFAEGLWLDRWGMSILQTMEDAVHFHNFTPLAVVGEELALRTVELFNHEMRERDCQNPVGD